MGEGAMGSIRRIARRCLVVAVAVEWAVASAGPTAETSREAAATTASAAGGSATCAEPAAPPRIVSRTFCAACVPTAPSSRTDGASTGTPKSISDRPALRVAIDVLPDDVENVVDPYSMERIAVVILGSPYIDARAIDPQTV